MRNWGKHTHSAPLYAHLVGVIADSPVLLAIINQITHRPQPNMLFAGVQYLLAEDRDNELAGFYGSLSDPPEPPEEAGEPFTHFVTENAAALIEIGNTRYTQTNECRRCVALLPLVLMSGFDSFHLIDLGTSAGLNLAMDLYSYRFDDLSWGPESSVVLKTEVRGVTPSLREFTVLSRTGLDLNPINPQAADDRRWLEALVWPEHEERRNRLVAALDLLSDVETALIGGDALETLGPVLAALPPGEPAVVMNSFALLQLDEQQRLRIEEIADEARTSRPVFRASMELLHIEESTQLSVDDGLGATVVGGAHPHGEWIEFYARP